MEAKLVEFKNQIYDMNSQDDMKDFLKERAETWKEILRQNCVCLTSVWE